MCILICTSHTKFSPICEPVPVVFFRLFVKQTPLPPFGSIPRRTLCILELLLVCWFFFADILLVSQFDDLMFHRDEAKAQGLCDVARRADFPCVLQCCVLQPLQLLVVLIAETWKSPFYVHFNCQTIQVQPGSEPCFTSVQA